MRSDVLPAHLRPIDPDLGFGEASDRSAFDYMDKPALDAFNKFFISFQILESALQALPQRPAKTLIETFGRNHTGTLTTVVENFFALRDRLNDLFKDAASAVPVNGTAVLTDLRDAAVAAAMPATPEGDAPPAPEAGIAPASPEAELPPNGPTPAEELTGYVRMLRTHFSLCLKHITAFYEKADGLTKSRLIASGYPGAVTEFRNRIEATDQALIPFAELVLRSFNSPQRRQIFRAEFTLQKVREMVRRNLFEDATQGELAEALAEAVLSQSSARFIDLAESFDSVSAHELFTMLKAIQPLLEAHGFQLDFTVEQASLSWHGPFAG